jgi:rod shape-determining protein MreC
MIKSHDAHSKSTLILHLPRTVRTFLKRFILIMLLVAAVAGVLASRDDSPFSDSIRTSLVDFLSPFISFVSAPINFVGETDDSIKSYMFAREKNKKLAEENKELRNQLINLSTVAYENDGLRKLLNYVKDVPYKFVSAKVVGDTSDPFMRSLLINAGKKDNIKKGQAVVNQDGLIGRITEVGERSSRVLLLTDINSNVPVISNKSRERSIVSGNNNESPDLAYLPKDTKMEAGEVLVTSGDGELFPAGLQVGIAYTAGANSAFKVKPFVEWHRLDNLSIIEYPK